MTPPLGLPVLVDRSRLPRLPIELGVPIDFALEKMLVDLALLHFAAETNPLGPAIDLSWELPDPAAAPDALQLRILRRVRRYPGKSRRGVVPQNATSADLAEGTVVYDTATIAWDLQEIRDEVLPDMLVSTTRQFFYRGAPRDRVLVRTITREFALDGTPKRTVVRFVDRAALEVGTIYYYTAFVGSTRRFSRRTQASALATGSGGPELFRLLPRIDQQRDVEPPDPFTVANSEHDRGQLERLLRVVQSHSDMLLGFVDGHRDLHDPRRVDARLLESMAALLGWSLKDYLDEEGQRNEIEFAPEVYSTLGTQPNIAAMVNRLTGWTADVREFARNVVLSWDATRVERFDAGPAYLDGSAHVEGAPPVLVTRARPAGTVDTADAAAMFRLRNRTFEDTTVYTYDCGVPDTLPGSESGYSRNDATWYNRETIGVYATPDVPTEPFLLQQTWERVREILAEFLPLQVRAVLFIRPDLIVEDPYDATVEVLEDVTTRGTIVEPEDYDAASETDVDRIPAWRWLITNQLASRSVNTAVLPVDVSHRTRHIGVEAGP